MIVYKLYVKTHTKTGLRYLGFTTKNPFTYAGSGLYWTRHLDTHGHDVRTVVIHEAESMAELKHWGKYYSAMWNVVESEQWANLKDEEGQGNSSETAKRLMNQPETKAKQSESAVRAHANPETKAKHRQSQIEAHAVPEYKAKRKASQKVAQNRPETLAKKSASGKRVWDDPEYKQRMIEIRNEPEYKQSQRETAVRLAADPEIKARQKQGAKEAQNRPETKAKHAATNALPEVKAQRSASATEAQNRPEVKAKQTGKNNHRYDHTIYTFIHDDGTIETMTRGEMAQKYPDLRPNLLGEVAKGNMSHHRGWRIVSSTLNTV